MDGPQCYGLTFNLIMRSDGKKMGKSEKARYSESSDVLAVLFFPVLEECHRRRCHPFMKILRSCRLRRSRIPEPQRNINDAKERLAYEQTKIVHGEEEAEKALSAARAMFSGSGAAADREGMPSIEIPLTSLEDGIGVLSLFSMTDLCATNSDARRLVTQGGAVVNDRKVEDPKAVIDASWLDDHGEMVLKAGKKRYFRVVAK